MQPRFFLFPKRFICYKVALALSQKCDSPNKFNQNRINYKILR